MRKGHQCGGSLRLKTLFSDRRVAGAHLALLHQPKVCLMKMSDGLELGLGPAAWKGLQAFSAQRVRNDT